MSEAFTATDKTVFVIGAGASFEVKMPLGDDLVDLIASLVDIQHDGPSNLRRGDVLIARACNRLAQRDRAIGVASYWQAGRNIRDGMQVAQSIDNFLDQHKKDPLIVEVGKLAIVRAILDREGHSMLKVEAGARPNLGGLDGTWFNQLYRVLTENCQLEDLEVRFKRVVFIIFNYDRCVEHYLTWALQFGYHCSAAQASDLVASIETYHPYGIAGPAFSNSSNSVVAFGEEPDPDRMIELARGIKTFTEGTDENSSSICAIRHHTVTASRTVFLGFAFHRMNINLLYPIERPPRTYGRDLLGTGMGLSPEDLQIIRHELSIRSGVDFDSVKIKADTRCIDLFRTHRRSLGFVGSD
jgi:hypothetical protein